MRLSRRGLLIGGVGLVAMERVAARALPKTEADVVVIGAGLAGLMAAALLEGAGARVVVIEGANHVGGRTLTLDALPGKPDAGGIQVGSNYTRLLALARKHGVGLQPGGAFDRTALYHIHGQTVTEAQWPDAEVNRLVGAERQIVPGALGPFFGRRMGRLSDVDAWRSEQGGALDTPYDAALKAAGASDEAIRLIASNTDRGHLEHYSALNPVRSATFFASAGPRATLSVISGGSQRLAEAAAAALRNPPRLGQVVTGIGEGPDGVRVTLSSGRSITARHAICTIPFSVLRKIAIDGPSARAMKPLIDTLPYTHASFAYLYARDPFWNHDDLPRMIWSDDPLIGRVFVLGDDPAMLKVWLNGTDADAIDRVPPAEAGAAIIARIEAARPSAKGKLKLERMFSWQQEPMARGVFHHIGTGQQAMLARAVATEGGRLHFAGEHLAQSASGMEGALESGARAAANVIARL